jgi:hypothetical protein
MLRAAKDISTTDSGAHRAGMVLKIFEYRKQILIGQRLDCKNSKG